MKVRARIKRDRPRRLSIIGKIKIGEKTETATRALDYFRADGDHADEYRKAFGTTRPTKLTIMFPSDDLSEVCFERLEINKGSRLWAWGDGETFMVWNPSKEEFQPFTLEDYPELMEKIEEKCNEDSPKTPAVWRTKLYMRFFIFEVKTVFGLWQLKIGGEKSSIDPIISTVDQVIENAGRLAGVPFYLTISMQKSSKPGVAHKYPVVRLTPIIGQEAMDKVRELQEGGVEIRGLLTGDRIEKIVEIQAKQLGDGNE